jgi:ankyrin repeat protein
MTPVDEVRKKMTWIKHHISTNVPNNIHQALEQFENLLTLSEIESYLKAHPNAGLSGLKGILAKRWERIHETNMCYTSMPWNEVNKLCINIAKSIKGTDESISFYQLLMPSLQVLETIRDTHIDNLKLGEFILSDNGNTFIPLAECLGDASVSDHGELRHQVMINNNFDMRLSAHELQRVSKYSTQAKACFAALALLNNSRIHGRDLASELTRLMYALRGGGARGSGEEMNAGDAANLGIVAFKEYWDSLPETVQTGYYQQTQNMQNNLENCLGRLFRPNDSNYREVSYCVELIANRLEGLIPLYQTNIKSLSDLKKGFEDKVSLLNPTHQQQLCQNFLSIPPKHILSLIFKLNDAEQKAIFKGQYENALFYMLNEHPHELIEFDLNEELKEMVKSIPINSNDDTALMIALQKGASNSVQALLDWGAPLDTRNRSGKNVIDIALENNSPCLDLVLMHLVNLSSLEQHECLAHFENAQCPNVLFFAENRSPHLFEALIMKKLEQPLEVSSPFFNQCNDQGLNALMLASRQNNSKAILSLLKFDINLLNTVFENHPDSFARIIGLLNPSQAHQTHALLNPYDVELNNLFNHYQKMKKHANSNYNSAAQTLLKSCIQKKIEFIQSNQDIDSLEAFRINCLEAVNVASSTLGNHRGWKNILIKFLSIFLNPEMLGNHKFFKTTSKHLLEQLTNALKISGG